jgi:hypothetical protein
MRTDSPCAATAQPSPLLPLTGALLLAALALTLLLAGAVTPALAAPSAVGYDLSYPQCEAPLPTLASFAIVGVNGGLANDPNPCLAQQLAWASAAPGLQRPQLSGLSLYLSAADPGSGVADWPSPSAGTATGVTPYGPCDGSWSRACSYLYGVQRAGYSYALALAAAAPPLAPAAPPLAAAAPWWIDVENDASWATPAGSREWAQLNVAALHGYAAGLRAAGARGAIGLYSDAYQWRAITGLGPRSSRAYFPAVERDWVTGSTSLAQARRACAKPFSGSAVTLAQFSEAPYDRDYACPPPPQRRRRRRSTA